MLLKITQSVCKVHPQKCAEFNCFFLSATGFNFASTLRLSGALVQKDSRGLFHDSVLFQYL